jgi:hypothetical protein
LRVWQHGHVTQETYDDVLAKIRGLEPSLDRLVFAWTCEQLVRLSTHPGQLSRPSRTDGAVLMSQLVNQLQSFAGIATVGPLDVLLTLTRLHVPVDETERALAALEDVPSVWTEPTVTRAATGVEAFDIVPVIRDWVTGGGMNETSMPIDMGLFGPITEADLRGPASHEDVRYRVWPLDPTLPERTYGSYSGWQHIVLTDGHLPETAWPPILDGILTESTYTRDKMLPYVADLSRFDVLDPSITVPTTLAWLAEGRLPVGRFSDTLQWLFERGALRQLWPLGIAVAAAASAQAPKPTGLPALLGVLAVYAAEVPVDSRIAPPEIAALAEAKAASRSRAAARDLLAALEASRPDQVRRSA